MSAQPNARCNFVELVLFGHLLSCLFALVVALFQLLEFFQLFNCLTELVLCTLQLVV